MHSIYTGKKETNKYRTTRKGHIDPVGLFQFLYCNNGERDKINMKQTRGVLPYHRINISTGKLNETKTRILSKKKKLE